MIAIREELLASGNQCSVVSISRSTVIHDEPDIYHPGSAFQLVRLLLELKFDVLHLHIGGNIPTRVLGLMMACAVFGGGKSVVTLHSGGYPLSEEGKNASKDSLRGFAFRMFSRVIAVNQMMAEMFERYEVGKDRIRLILPFSHDLPDKTVEIPQEIKEFQSRHEPVLLSTSLLEKEYDIELQIEALEEIVKEFPRAGLLIAGSGSLEGELRDLINKKGHSERVLMTGDVDHKIALNLTDDCDILLRTTLYDGDAISVREALFLETPVIATDNGMRPEGVYLIPVHDSLALSNRVKALATQEKREKREKKEDRSNIMAVIELYREIVG